MSATAMLPRRGLMVGRFKLQDELGRGAQATVWRAHDERLDRDVALKLLNAGTDSVAVSQWLHEARAVSRLAHPHIVPVFEADDHAGQPYLVFELVQGRTLSEALRSGKPLPPRKAVEMMLGVLDALRLAHEHGIVHRDLKPSNILIDADGRARVMDFGIAARAADTGDGRIVGTPGYMSPEAARGLPPTPLMDVFAAGMVLAAMLTGQSLIREKDPYRAIERVVNEDLNLPDGAGGDDALRAIVQRAIARDPALRMPGASALRDALQRWLQPGEDVAGAPAAGAAAAATNGTLEFLLRRMRQKSDFPALSDSVTRIQRIAASENESVNSLASEILKDVALTNKLLRAVNTAHFKNAAGNISTVSRAVALVGFAGIRNMALSLVLIEHMKDKGHAQRLKEEFLRSLMAGQLASELSTLARDAEEAFLGAMFQNLGRLLAEFYFPEEAQSIREQVDAATDKPGPLRPNSDAVAERVLGISFEALGIGVARNWGLPDVLQRCMRNAPSEVPTRPLEAGAERQRWLAAAANAAADVILRSEPGEVPAQLEAVAERYGRALSISASALKAATESARHMLSQLAPAMGLALSPDAKANRLLQASTPGAADAADAQDSLSPYELAATLPMPMTAAAIVDKAHAARAPEKVAEMLTSGIQDITNTMAGERFRLDEVLRMILETMYRALDFRCVVFCLRDARTETLMGRIGIGTGVEEVKLALKVPLRATPGAAPDLFTAVCLKGVDTLIADAWQPQVASRLPGWFVKSVNAPSFLLLPLSMKNAPFALIYADKPQPGGLVLGERELALLRTLRNQAVMAFRQAGT